jgi:hypothetical protein
VELDIEAAMEKLRGLGLAPKVGWCAPALAKPAACLCEQR